MLSPNDHEIETLEEFDRVAASGSLRGHRVQSVDLTTRTPTLMSADTADAVFLGCRMEPEAAARVRAGGALVFPPVPNLPFDPYRGSLYDPDELFEGLAEGYEATPDARAYAVVPAHPGERRHLRLDAAQPSTTTRCPTPSTNSSRAPASWA